MPESVRNSFTNFSYLISEIECIQLTEPGMVIVICQIRFTLNRDQQPFCLFDQLAINVPCKYYSFVITNMCMLITTSFYIIIITGTDINNIVLTPSEIPLVAGFLLPTNVSLFISTFDPMGTRHRMTLDVTLSKFCI